MTKKVMRGFRQRTHRSGKTYYYFDKGRRNGKREEIPLGSDYVVAVQQWADLMKRDDVVVVPTFEDLATKYELEVMPKKAKSTQTTQRGDLKLLREFFNKPKSAPLDQIKPKHIFQLLEWRKDTPTTANRLKRMFSHMFNMARAWGWTDRENPVTGVRGHSIDARDVAVTDEVYAAIWNEASEPTRDGMDLMYLTGQRPGDAVKMTTQHIAKALLAVKQGKTAARLRIRVEGEFKALLERIEKRKRGYKVHSAHLLVNERGLPLTYNTLSDGFIEARKAAAAKHDEGSPFRQEIEAAWLYDLRSKAADDVADEAGDDQAAANLLGHATVSTTRRHYLRRGKIVGPTK